VAGTPFEYFLAQKRQACTDLLEKNEDVSGFFAAVLDHLVEFSRQEGVSMQRIQLDRPFVTADGKIIAQIRIAPDRP
jgi:hypothetical protein